MYCKFNPECTECFRYIYLFFLVREIVPLSSCWTAGEARIDYFIITTSAVYVHSYIEEYLGNASKE